MTKDFDLLKRTYPVSQYNRVCDGYDYILKHTTRKERRNWKIKKNTLQRIISVDEKYIYQVAKEDDDFKTMCLCYSNYAIIRKHIFGLEDE